MAVKIFIGGDYVNSLGRGDFLGAALKRVVANCDLAMINFEAPLATPGAAPIAKAGPHLTQHQRALEFLHETGFTHLALANNHIYDFGLRALENTLAQADKLGLETCGAGVNFNEAYKPRLFAINGLKIGWLAAAENEFGCLYENRGGGGYPWLFHPQLEDNIKSLKAQADFVLLNCHAGVENAAIPLPEWRERYRRLCDLGVDVIMGAHPHVPQGHEKYNNSLIIYSAGNFYFDAGKFADSADESYSMLLNLSLGEAIGHEIIYHKKINGQTEQISPETANFSVADLNAVLGEDYQRLYNELALKVFADYYDDYYRIAAGALPVNKGLLGRLKYLAGKILRRPSPAARELLLLHNIRIDSHRFVVQRALSLRREERA